MTLLDPKLPADFQHDLQKIRTAVAARFQSSDEMISLANRLLARLDHWLLDDEQRQALEEAPMQGFCLHAGAYLAGATVGSAAADRPSWGLENRKRIEILRQFQRQISMPVAHDPESVRSDTTDVDLGLPAACIRLSRALELKAPVTLEEIAGLWPPDGERIREGWPQHFDLLDAGPHPHLPATIRVRIACRHGEVHRALKHHERRVQALLHHFNERVRPRFLYSDVIYEIEPSGYRPMDLKFSVDSSAALQLFMGRRLYTDKRVFLRELIQNAVDACSLRRLAEPAHESRIELAFNEDISVITIRDNGIGMDRQWVEKYFLSIGISFYKSDRIQDINRDGGIDIGFISQFGIGFLSSFLVAEKIVIKTRKAGDPGLKITIAGLKDYFDVRPLEETLPVGTEVELHLKKSKINLARGLEYPGYLKTNIRFLQVPVEFTDEHGRTVTIGRSPLAYSAVKKAPTDFTAALEFEHSEGYLYLGTMMHSDQIFALGSAKGGISLFQDGIFIAHDDGLLPEAARQNVIGRINLRGADKCELSMDRNRIFWSSHQKKHIRRLIGRALAGLANQVITAMDHQGVTGNDRDSVINHLAIFFDFGEVDDQVHQALAPPLQRIVEKRFRDFIRIHFAHTLRSEGIPEADGYNEPWQRRILESFNRKN